MKYVILIYFFFLISFGNSFSQELQNYKGILYLQNTGETILNAHIINVNKGYGTTSNNYGYFSIPFECGDSIIISAIQCEKKWIKPEISFDTSLVFLSQALYFLPIVKVMPFSNYDEFKQAVLDLPEDKIYPAELAWFRDYFNENRVNQGVAGFSPITMLYNAYSKKAKEMKRYNYLVESEKQMQTISKKYNQQLVSRLTGLTNHEEIKKFMEFCHLPSAFILESKEYELYLAVMQCMEEFKKQ